MVFLAALLIQEPVGPPALVRRLKAKQKVAYQVKLTSIGEQIARHEYRLELQVLPSVDKTGPTPVAFNMTQAKSEFGSNVFSRQVLGSVSATLQPTGFAEGLSFGGSALLFSLPLLAFWLPEQKFETDKRFPVQSPYYDRVIRFLGETSVSPPSEGRRTIRSDFNLQVSGEQPDNSKLRKLRITMSIDERDGLPRDSEGKYTAPDGTVTYTFRRL